MDRATLYDKIYACWLGKCIGRTQGIPMDDQTDVHEISPLDLTLLSLHAVESYGLRLTSKQIAAEWIEHCYFSEDEYGHAGTALRLGFTPPFSGMFDNHFTDCTGGLGRAELWAVIAAGNPCLAAELARRDALIDHAGGEGMYGEIFLAALAAAAFKLSDVPALIREALTYIPDSSRTHGAATFLLSMYEKGTELTDAVREAVIDAYGSPNFTDTPQNIAFILAGLLWGRDAADAICKTVRLGGNTACTASACGAVWGILYGRESFSQNWIASVDTGIRISDSIRGFRAPDDLDELACRCMDLYDQSCCKDAELNAVAEADIEDFAVQYFTLPQGANAAEAFCVAVRYEDNDPTVAPERPQNLRITLTNNTTWLWTIEARMECPYGLAADVPAQILVAPGESVLYNPTVKADSNAYYSVPVDRVYPVSLVIKRLNCGDRWNIYRLPIALLAPNRWILNGNPVRVPGATVQFTELTDDGVYVAEATLCTPPVTRETRMICNCVWPTTVELDGDVIMHTEGLSPFLPSYHRIPADQCRDGILQRGFHKVKVTIRMPEDARDILPLFVVSLNAPAQVTEPGNFYAYTDVHFAR